MKVKCIDCGRRDTIVRKVLEWERKKILCLEYRVERKGEWWNWGEVAHPIEGKA